MSNNILEGYTRISTILSILPSIAGNNEDGQILWGFPFQTINQEVLKKKCLIGTNVHQAINSWASNDFSPLTECEKGYFDSFLIWKEIVKLKPIESELRLYDDNLKITGAIDMLGKIEGSDSLILFDFKTSSVADLKKWPLQAAFYHHLLTVNKFSINGSVLFVQLNKNGEVPTCHTFPIDNKLKTLMISTYNIYKHLTER